MPKQSEFAPINVAMAQMDINAGHTRKNLKKAFEMVDKARDQKADMVVFPEMLWGYMVADMLENQSYVEDRMGATQELGEYSQGITLIMGEVIGDVRHGDPRAAHNRHNPLARGNDGRFLRYNTGLIWQDGRPVSPAQARPTVNGLPLFPYENMTVKTNLPLYHQFEDQRHMLPLKELAQRVGVPLEDLLQPFVIDHQGQPLKVGILICEDIWIGDYFYNGKLLNPAEILRDNGADILIAISSSPSRLGKNASRIANTNFLMNELQRTGRKTLPFLSVNHIGTQDNGKNIYIFDGRSRSVSADGRQQVEMPALKEGVQVVRVPVETSETFEPTPEISETKAEQHQYLLETLGYGLKSFCEKRGMKRMVIGLSGGIDSALAAYLAVRVLGPENVLTVNMPTRFNSQMTQDAARDIAEVLGTEYVVVPIESLVNEVRAIIKTVRWHGDAGVFNEDFPTSAPKNVVQKVMGKAQKLWQRISGKTQARAVESASAEAQKRAADRRLVDENLQAKTRAIDILSNIASMFKAVFSNNGNKSEMLQGFLTVDGDGRGFLQLIGDLFKTEIIDLCTHINELEIAAGRPAPIPWGLIVPLFDGERYYDNWDGIETPIPADVQAIVASAELSEEQDVTKGKGDPIHFIYHDFLLKKWEIDRADVSDVARALVEGGMPGIKAYLGLTKMAMERTFGTYFKTPADFVADLERRWNNYHLTIFKEIQSPPVISVSPRPEGFDHRRAQISAEYTQSFYALKEEILKHNDWEYWQ